MGAHSALPCAYNGLTVTGAQSSTGLKSICVCSKTFLQGIFIQINISFPKYPKAHKHLEESFHVASFCSFMRCTADNSGKNPNASLVTLVSPKGF